MNENEYLEKRLENQRKWYSKKSGINKKWYRYFQLTQLVMAALVTLSGMFAYLEIEYLSFIIVPVLGALIAIVSGILGLYKFQENWTGYRTTSEALQQEKHLFLTKTAPYHDEDAFNLLVNRVESLISQENTKWGDYMSKKAVEEEKGKKKDS